jgi:hypothetical protein
MLSGWTSFFLSFFSFFIFFWLYFYLYLQFFISSFHSGFDFPICISTQMSFEANRSSMQIRYVYRGGDRSFLFFFWRNKISKIALRTFQSNVHFISFPFDVFFWQRKIFNKKNLYVAPFCVSLIACAFSVTNRQEKLKKNFCFHLKIAHPLPIFRWKDRL